MALELNHEQTSGWPINQHTSQFVHSLAVSPETGIEGFLRHDHGKIVIPLGAAPLDQALQEAIQPE